MFSRILACVFCILFAANVNASPGGDTDGDVDLDDLNNVRNNFGGTGLGDTNKDGVVDLIDLNNVRIFFGFSAPQAVPEPSSLALLAIGAAGMVAFRRRCRATVSR